MISGGANKSHMSLMKHIIQTNVFNKEAYGFLGKLVHACVMVVWLCYINKEN